MIAKKQVKLFVCLNCIVAILIAGTSYVVDPFYLFHKPIWEKPTFNSQDRNLGQIETFLKKTDDYDSILIGTSHTMNFIGNEISKSLDSKGTLKLCLGGGYPVELEAIAQKAFSSKKVKKVLWGFETIFFTKPAYTPHPQRVFPYFLYTSFFGKYTLLINHQILKETIWSLVYHLSNYRLLSNRILETKLDKTHYYYDTPYIAKQYLQFCSESNLQDIKSKKETFDTFKHQVDSKVFSAIDEHFIPLIENHPETEFYVLLMPYSCAYFISLGEQEYQDILACQRYLIQHCSKFPNVRFYAFNTCEFTQNLGNYYNQTHYHPDINRYMLYAIEKDCHRLTLSNLDAYEKAMISNLKSFEVKDAYPKKDTLEDLIKNEKKSLD